MPNIVLVDLTCPKPYSLTTLKTAPLGGSEASVIRNMTALAASSDLVPYVAQHCRTEAVTEEDVHYVPLSELENVPTARSVIAFRSPKSLAYMQKRWPDAKRFAWCQDFVNNELVEDIELLRGAKIICVSRMHKSSVISSFLSRSADLKGITVDFVYNSIDDNLQPDDSTMYSRRYVFFSSPHKGLERTLELFQVLRAKDKNSELFVANPGYYKDHDKWPEGVTNLGPLPHHEVIKYVRSAQCVLNLNDVFPETFGIVFAEASAVGTPTLTAPVGAAVEILGDRHQTVDVRNTQAVLERLDLWQRQRPVVKANEEFRQSNITKRWKELLS